MPCGDQDGAAGRGPGQQGPHLGLVGRVVQQYQHTPPGQQAPVQGGPLPGVRGHRGSVDAEAAQESGQDLGRVGPGRPVGAAQVDVELSVGELPAQAVRDPQGERGLAYAGCARDHAERAPAAAPQGPPQALRLFLPPDERLGRGRQLSWSGAAGTRAPYRPGAGDRPTVGDRP